MAEGVTNSGGNVSRLNNGAGAHEDILLTFRKYKKVAESFPTDIHNAQFNIEDG